MFKKSRKIFFVILITFLSFLILGLCGCYDYLQSVEPIKELNMNLDIKRNGWADLELIILFDKGLAAQYQDMIDQFKNTMKDQGYSIEPYTSEDLVGFKALVPVNMTSKQEISKTFGEEIFLNLESESGESPLIIDKGFLYDYYKFYTTITSMGIAKQIFSLTLPGEVITNNADTIEGNKLTWEFSNNITIEAESKVLNVGYLVLLIVIIAGVIIGIGFLIYKIGKPQVSSAIIRKEKFCSGCGNPISSENFFCKKCGKKL